MIIVRANVTIYLKFNLIFHSHYSSRAPGIQDVEALEQSSLARCYLHRPDQTLFIISGKTNTATEKVVYLVAMKKKGTDHLRFRNILQIFVLFNIFIINYFV